LDSDRPLYIYFANNTMMLLAEKVLGMSVIQNAAVNVRVISMYKVLTECIEYITQNPR